LNIVAIVLEVLLGLMFIMAGVTKIVGQKMHVDNFAKWGLPQWFRVVTGLIELVAGAAMIVGIWQPSWAAWAGVVLVVTMIGAVLTHVRIKDTFKNTVNSIVLLVLSVVVLWIQNGELANFPGFN